MHALLSTSCLPTHHGLACCQTLPPELPATRHACAAKFPFHYYACPPTAPATTGWFAGLPAALVACWLHPSPTSCIDASHHWLLQDMTPSSFSSPAPRSPSSLSSARPSSNSTPPMAERVILPACKQESGDWPGHSKSIVIAVRLNMHPNVF